ncbi:MAG: RluA family pseudouridine synthase [Myxococcota bacterium]
MAPEIPPGCDPESILLTFPVAREQAGMRLDRFLQTRIPRISRTRANAIVRNCAYRADGTKRRASDRVRAGEVVLIVRPPMNEPPTPQHFGVLYEDEDVLAVDKPAGLPMHPTATYHKHTLSWLLAVRYGANAPQFAHRLDRETSGVVVCGKHGEAEVALKLAFERRQVSKVYLAIVRGVFPAARRVVDFPLGPKGEGLHLLMSVREDGARAVTRIERLEVREGATLLRLSPESGRQHQLRVHLAALGMPIIGDKLYGPDGPAPFLAVIDDGPSNALLASLGHGRQALHAHRLTLPHPRTGAPLTLESPLPPDLEALWSAPGAVLAGRPVRGWEVLYGAAPAAAAGERTREEH